MATRMQQRRGTAAQWISTNAGAGPVLNSGEIGWESDTNKFKIGDGINNWSTLDYFIDGNSTANPAFGSSITFEGATANDFETTVAVTDPTADRTITLPDATGTVVLADGSGNITVSGNLTVSGTTTTINSTTINATTGIVFEGATANDFETTLTVTDPTADRTLTLPDATDTLVGRATTDTLTNKSISLGSNTVTSTLAQLNTAITDADVASLAGSETLTNKTISLASNTVSGTIAQFNTAVTDADLATLAGTETLTNKTLTSPVINTPTGITKTDVGLANVDNTTDANKPVSTATQTALDLKANLAAPALTGDATAVNLTISGNLTVNGTTTNLNSTNLVVEDKNIILADVETPTDTTANGGGITLKGATDKTLNWVDATDAWTSSEDFNLLTGKVYEIAGTSVLSGTTLGSGVTGSSLTSVGTITSGTWTGTTIAIANGGTGQTTAMTAATALLPDQASNSGKYLTTNGSGTLSWGTVSGYSAPTLGSTSVASGATVTTITGLTLSGATLTGTLTAGGGVGTSGQVLSSTGTGTQWIAASAPTFHPVFAMV
jgi:hypothetical protein